MSLKFHTLRISDIVKTTDDCVVITFDIPQEIRNTFKFIQGQHLTLKATVNGEELLRNYSLCSSPPDNEWKIAIKQIPDGRFSTYANNSLKKGDTIEVASPEGSFYVEINNNRQNNYLAFAAGSGITPIISIIKTHLQAEPKANFKLFYSNKTVASIILKEELEALKNIYLDRFEIFYFLTQEQRTIPLLNGRISREKLEIIFKSICEPQDIDHFFACGPEEMVLLIRDFLVEKDVDTHNIHIELFHAEGAAPELKEKLVEQYEGQSSKVELKEGGKIVNFEMPQGSETLLDAALKNDADLPFACKGGVCCTCKAKLLEGEVKMLVNYGLEEDEVEDGFILTCQSLPITDNIKVDFDI